MSDSASINAVVQRRIPPWRALFRACGSPLGLGVFAILFLGLACSGPEKTSPPRREDLESLWRLYLANDPGWPEARESWMGGPQEDRDLLLSNLMRELLADQPRAKVRVQGEPMWFRPMQELSEIGEPARKYAWEALEIAVARRDTVGKARLAELVARVDDADAISVQYRKAADDKLYRLSLLDVAQAQSGTGTEVFLADVLSQDPQWEARAKAAEALSKREELSSEATCAKLVEALADEDLFVARKVAIAVEEHRCPDSAEALIRLLRRAERSADTDAMDVVMNALMTVTGRLDLGTDFRAWQEAFRHVR